jgi:DNA-binding XRE family transcriptional regulator
MYDEDLLVELVADSELTHGEIAQRVGVSRRTVWLIANGRSRPDLQQQIADTVEGYRQAAIRLAAKHMRVLLEKQIQVALADNGETSRKAREFLLKNFMNVLSDEPARSVEKRRTRLAEKKQVQADLKYERELAIKKHAEEMTNEQFLDDWGDDDDDQYAADNNAAPLTGNPAGPTIDPPAVNQTKPAADKSPPAPAAPAAETTQTEPPEPAAQHSDRRTEPDPAPDQQKTERETADPVQPEDVFAQSRRIMAQASQAALAGYD